MSLPSDLASPIDDFPRRHLGDDDAATAAMLKVVGWPDAAALAEAAVPASIRRPALELPAPLGESAALAELRGIAGANRPMRSFIGMGYYDTATPGVIQRNILENPAWYTAYTPYQAEISQGRLEALLHFQTLIAELTGLEIANASLLDEGTAAAEAMLMCRRAASGAGAAPGATFFVSEGCHPQTIDLVRTRARPLGLRVQVGDPGRFKPEPGCFGVLVQYPDTFGAIHDFGPLFEAAHAAGALCVAACDPLALAVLRPPGQFGADVAVGCVQRFGTPMGFGGPHAGFMATRDALKRQMPGRLVGVSRDPAGAPALRLSLGTREQHIRRDKATSNICTAQVLPAVMASMYALYHGPDGLRRIARRVHALTAALAGALRAAGVTVREGAFFDTLVVRDVDAAAVHRAAEAAGFALRRMGGRQVGLSLDETTTLADAGLLASFFGVPAAAVADGDAGRAGASETAPFGAPHDRQGPPMTAAVFRANRTEHEMLRTIRRLESRDLSLVHSMIPLGSCTMKLNATSEMIPLSWPEFARPHPFSPASHVAGYARIVRDLEAWLAAITGLPAVSLQPNAGSQGEYAGMLAIRGWQEARGQGARNVCLIPASAHGTNPATAALCGLTVVPVACDARGNVDLDDLRARVAQHAHALAALMITYPSTHGVFEEGVREICTLIHANGGQVYMDGANMNAQVGLTSPGHIGADVCHLNLHKTFCIPHGGGGPGAGPIAVAAHLAAFLPGHAVAGPGARGPDAPEAGAVSSAPWGSASILVIPWMYIRMMGAAGLTKATQVAILNANYVARRLDGYFPVLYKGARGLVAHECIIDLRGWKAHGIEAEDVAKRLMDYGFHAPTLSFPVPGTFMIEPTESESKEELDRFCEALIGIHAEMQEVAGGRASRTDNLLKNAPHTAQAVCADSWTHPYSRERAAFPAPWTRASKFWPAVGRVDNVWGDRNLVCSCAGMEAYQAEGPPGLTGAPGR